MSVDREVTENIMEILEDGKKGFADAAEKLRESDRPDLAPRFEKYSAQRAEFSTELERMAAAYGDDVEESGSIKGTLHRTWMSLKDAFSGDDPGGILDAAEQGEDKAVETYREALDRDMSPELRSVLERQLADVQAAHDDVKAMRDAS